VSADLAMVETEGASTIVSREPRDAAALSLFKDPRIDSIMVSIDLEISEVGIRGLSLLSVIRPTFSIGPARKQAG